MTTKEQTEPNRATFNKLVKACEHALHTMIVAQCDAANLGGDKCAEAQHFEPAIKQARAALKRAKGNT